jgi:phosphoadenosine phosphosulfate reductase
MIHVKTTYKNDSLEEKVKTSLNIITETLSRAKNPYALFTGRIDSLVMIHLIRRLQDGTINLPVLHIDTTIELPEIYQFIEKMQRLWGFQLVRESNDVALQTLIIAEDNELCCHLLKTETLRGAIDKYEIDFLFLAKRLDSKEKDDIFFVNEKIISVNPLRNFFEKDIWDYIEKYNLPYCSLYSNNRKKIMCSPCTHTNFRKKPEKKEFFEGEKDIAKKLRALGYV